MRWKTSGSALNAPAPELLSATPRRTAGEARLNTKRWKARSGQGRLRTAEDREHDRLRQQRHRDLELLRPREPAADGLDPSVLALEGLHALSRLRGLARTKDQHGNLERAEETIRRLAVGARGLETRVDGRWRNRSLQTSDAETMQATTTARCATESSSSRSDLPAER